MVYRVSCPCQFFLCCFSIITHPAQPYDAYDPCTDKCHRTGANQREDEIVPGHIVQEVQARWIKEPGKHPYDCRSNCSAQDTLDEYGDRNC